MFVVGRGFVCGVGCGIVQVVDCFVFDLVCSLNIFGLVSGQYVDLVVGEFDYLVCVDFVGFVQFDFIVDLYLVFVDDYFGFVVVGDQVGQFQQLFEFDVVVVEVEFENLYGVRGFGKRVQVSGWVGEWVCIVCQYGV